MLNFNSEFFKRSNFDPDFIRSYQSENHWQRLDVEFGMWLATGGESNQKIPKVIHQVWIGGKIPEKYKRWTESWLVHNPDYDYILWDDRKVQDLSIVSTKVYMSQVNLGAKSDILRYYILEKFGGIYADTDFECLRPIPTRLLCSSGFAGLGYDNKPVVLNGLIGSEPGSRILQYILDRLLHNFDYCVNSTNSILKTTGPYMFTDVLLNNFLDYDSSGFVILPSTYFYPHPKYAFFTTLEASSLATPHTFAIHHWECSWMRPTLISRLKSKCLSVFRHAFKNA